MEEKNKCLRLIAAQHDEWVSIVKGFGEHFYCEDIVQEAYIAIYKYARPENIIKNNKVSRGYMFFTLRNLYYQLYNKKKKIIKVRLDHDENFLQIPYTDNVNENIAFHKICILVDNLADKWHWYDKKLWKLYSQTDMSIRKLASETKISWVSIFNSLKYLKKEIKKELKEDYEDFINKDYDRI